MEEDQTIQSIRKKLQSSGCRLTAQRMELASVLFENRERHLTVEEIHALAKFKRPKVSLATVYKAIQQFEKLGLLYRISIHGGSSRYQLLLPGGECLHQHFICLKCGKVLDIDTREFAQAEHSLESRYGVVIESPSILYYGTCRECTAAEPRKAQAEPRRSIRV